MRCLVFVHITAPALAAHRDVSVLSGDGRRPEDVQEVEKSLCKEYNIKPRALRTAKIFL